MAIQRPFFAKQRDYIDFFQTLWNLYRGFVPLVDAATVNIDITQSPRLQQITLGGNRTLNFTGGAVALGDASLVNYDRKMILLEVIQDGTGTRIPVLGTGWHFPASFSSITFSTAAGKIDLVAGYYDHAHSRINIATFVNGW